MHSERNRSMKLKLPTIRNKQATARNKALPDSEGLAHDCALAARIIEGNTAALERLVERHVARVNRYLHHRLGAGHEPLIQTVVKATFDEALRHLRPYAKGTASTPMEYWLIRLAERNVGKLQHIKGKAQATATTPQKDGDKAEGDLAIVRRALTALPRKDSFVLALALFEGMSAPEIASSLGVGQARSLRRLRSALAAISKQLPISEGAI